MFLGQVQEQHLKLVMNLDSCGDDPPLNERQPSQQDEVDFLFVPCDDEEWAKPRRPPTALESVSKPMLHGPLLSLAECKTPQPKAFQEEEDWLARKRVTGVISKLVQYQESEIPSRDIIGLHRSGTGRLMVTAVRSDGPAMRSGIVAGDQLISVNGETVAEYHPAKAVLNGIRGPAILIFLGFSGKLQAEVRVKQPDEPRCGLPVNASVTSKVLAQSIRAFKFKKDDSELQQQAEKEIAANLLLTDAVDFQQVTGSLLLATETGLEDDLAELAELSGENAHLALPLKAGVFELLAKDAKDIVARALESDDACV